ncbi:Gfo/Idh/MocA family protein [Zavarzinia sp.]|uniref:Gfo/Idh/MocA family protein n=1 Tax=Zavarzinia sp. TaxID=2027920 RepID=UPI00356ACAFC
MITTFPLGAVIVGCGHIAQPYAKAIKTYNDVALLGFQDLEATRAQTFAREFGGRAYGTFDEVLADPRVNLVVNLTIHQAHEEVITRALEAGKHVHTEKPLALTYATARRLAALAEQRGLRLSSAPATYLGEAQQTIARELRRGAIGPVRLVYAEINHGRIETWHANPVPFYEVGVLWDVGIYPLTLLTAFLGPVQRVTAQQRLLLPARRTKAGQPFNLTKPEFVNAVLDFAGGVVGRLTCNFYTNGSKQGAGIEFHGDGGSLILGSVFKFNAPVERCAYGEPLQPLPLVRPGYEGVEFARGVKDMAAALREGRPHRVAAAHAAHVIEVMELIDASARAGGESRTPTSRFSAPEPMEWAG